MPSSSPSRRLIGPGIAGAVAAGIASTFVTAPVQALEPNKAPAQSRTTHIALGPSLDIARAAHGLSAAGGQGLSAAAAQAAPGRAAQAVSAAAPARSYTVRAGDTIWGISQRTGVRMTDLMSWNGLRTSLITPGQVLALGGAAAAAPATTPATAPAIAPATASTAAPASNAAASVTVRRGDTMSAIASRAGVSLSALLQLNGLSRTSIIYPGQTILLRAATPAASAQPSAPTQPATTPAPAAAPAPAAQPTPAAASAPAPQGTQATATLDAEQRENARIIIRVGRELGVSDRGIAIALGTAMVESWIRNLSWGDRDSQGLFQQRPSQGWGTVAQVRDPERSARAFFGGPSDPNGWNTRGLLDIRGWESMSFTEAAQAVQRSGYPTRYAQWETASYQWLAELG